MTRRVLPCLSCRRESAESQSVEPSVSPSAPSRRVELEETPPPPPAARPESRGAAATPPPTGVTLVVVNSK